MVLETVALIRPAMAMMSPASACSTGTRSSPWKANSLVARPSSTTLPFDIHRLDRVVDADRAAFDPAREDPAEERIAIEQGGDHPERTGIYPRPRHVRDDGLEQRRQIPRAHVVRKASIARASRSIERREVQLLVICFEVEEQLEHLVEHFGGAGVRPVDLVDDDDRLEAQRQRLAGNELGLGHRPFGRVDEQDHSVDHAKDALDLGTEVGVARACRRC